MFLKHSIKILASLCALLLSCSTIAHPGGLDARGGHTDRSTGLYHCHREDCEEQENTSRHTESTTQQRTDPSDCALVEYDRSSWPHWVDTNGNCRDARQEALLEVAVGEVLFESESRCRVKSGQFFGLYTGEIYDDPSILDADHIVTLKNAHLSGGCHWSRDRKREFANDPENIWAVHRSQNRSKGARAPYEWMPEFVDSHCLYVSRWIQVKRHYDLTIDPRTEDKLARLCE